MTLTMVPNTAHFGMYVAAKDVIPDLSPVEFDVLWQTLVDVARKYAANPCIGTPAQDELVGVKAERDMLARRLSELKRDDRGMR